MPFSSLEEEEGRGKRARMMRQKAENVFQHTRLRLKLGDARTRLFLWRDASLSFFLYLLDQPLKSACSYFQRKKKDRKVFGLDWIALSFQKIENLYFLTSLKYSNIRIKWKIDTPSSIPKIKNALKSLVQGTTKLLNFSCAKILCANWNGEWMTC